MKTFRVLRINNLVLIILLTAVLLTGGCGFQLRGTLALSNDISPLYIQQNSARELARDLKWLLGQNKIVVTDDDTNPVSRLDLLAEDQESHVLTVDGDGRAREYLLTYKVDVLIKTKQAGEVNESITLSRSLLFDPEAVLAFTNEANRLYSEMRENAAHLILLKLQAYSGRPAADNGEPKSSQTTAEPDLPSSPQIEGGTP